MPLPRSAVPDAAPSAGDALAAAVVEAVPDAILVFDAAGRCVAANPAAAALLGYDRTELAGLTWANLAAPGDDRPTTPPAPDGGWQGEVTLRRNDGSVVVAEARTAPIAPEAGLLWCAVLRDATTRRQAEAARRAARFRALVEEVGEFIAVVDAAGVVRYQGPAVERILGFDPAAQVGRSGFDFLHPDDVGPMRRVLADLLATPAHRVEVEVRARHRDGSWRTLEVAATNRLDDPDIGGIVVNSRDVTEERAAAAALRESEARYRDLVERLPVVVYVLANDERQTPLYYSPRMKDLFGLEPESLLRRDHSPDHWLVNVHPEDRERVAAEDARTTAAGEPFRAEYRSRRRDGSYVWVRDECEPVRDETGRIVAWQGVLVDVDDRKRVEEALQASHARFQSLIANASDIITILDADGTIRYESPAISRFLGYDPAALVGCHAFDLVHPDDRERVYAEFAALVADPTRQPRVEFRFRHADDSWRWLESVGTNLLADPAVGGVVVNSRDITERRRDEERLRQAEAHYRDIVETQTDLICRWLPDATLTFVNAAYCRSYGRSAADLIGTSFLDLIPATARAAVRGYLASQVRRPRRETYEHDVLLPSGSTARQQWTDQPIFDTAGRLVEFQSVGRDVTAERRLEAALREREREARDLLAAAERAAREAALLDRVRSAVARELELPSLFRTVVEAIADTFGYSQVSLYLREGDESVLQHQVGYDQVVPRIPVTEGISGRVLRTGEPALLEDVRTDPDFIGAVAGIQSEVCVPLSDQGKVVGFLNLESRGTTRLGPDDLRLMVALSEHVGVAISRARLYAAARLGEERFRAFMDRNPAPAWIKDAAGRFAFVNAAFGRLFAVAPAAMVGATDDALFPPAVAAGRRQEDRAVLATGQTLEVERLVPVADGGTRRFLTYKFPLTDAEGRRYVGGTAIDVTERAEAEAALRSAKEAAEAANRLKSAFLATMSHELRTPLTAITGYADLLLEGAAGDLNPQQTADVRVIADAATHLLGLIEGVLDLSRIEAGAMDLRLERVYLAGSLEEVRTAMAPQAAAKGLALVVKVEPGLVLVADRLRLRQVLLNLVGNALKFTEQGEVRVTARATADRVEVVVRDTGIGIAAADVSILFDAFRQAGSGQPRRHGGSGLGLTIAKRLVELHGGTIAVESAPGVGSTFTVSLPRGA